MKYLVMENHEAYSVVIDENGLFHRVANLGYEIGDTVTEPVFMRTPEKKKKTDWKKLATVAAIFVCLLMTAVPFINNSNESDVIVYMSINPQIHIEMNEDGKINKLVADNSDGKVLLEGYKYKDKNLADVLIELIDRAENMKYLAKGGDIHITVKAEANGKAKSVEHNLSEALKETYVKKYLIKIKANDEKFRRIDDVLEDDTKSSAETVQTTSEYKGTENNYTENVISSSENTYVNTTEASTEEQTAATKPSDNIKPTVKPTEKPSDATKPSEPATEEIKTDEPSSGVDEPTDDSDEEDWEWPWWPYSR